MIITVDRNLIATSNTEISPIDLGRCGLRTANWDASLHRAGYRRVSDWVFLDQHGDKFNPIF